jgi:hypothetical protein
VSKVFVETKLAEGGAVGPHVIKMVGYTHSLEKLGFPLGQELAIDSILISLPPSYGNFVSNHHMHGVENGLNEQCGMLKIADRDIKNSTSSSHMMAIQNKPSFKKKGSSWKKKGSSWKKKGKAKVENPKPNLDPKAKPGPTADIEGFYCHEKGHWKRNYKLYLASLKNYGSKSTSTSGTLVVHITKICPRGNHEDALQVIMKMIIFLCIHVVLCVHLIYP